MAGGRRGGERYMGIIRRYVRWVGHDAGGTLPPLTVCAGVVEDGGARGEAAPGTGELLVYVPPQWIGDWETGRPLPPGYQYLWRAPERALLATADLPADATYRPAELPPTARGPSFKRPTFRTAGSRRARSTEQQHGRQDE